MERVLVYGVLVYWRTGYRSLARGFFAYKDQLFLAVVAFHSYLWFPLLIPPNIRLIEYLVSSNISPFHRFVLTYAFFSYCVYLPFQETFMEIKAKFWIETRAKW